LEFKYRLDKISHNPIEWEYFQSELEKLSIYSLDNKTDALLLNGDENNTDLAASLFNVYRGRVTDLFSLCIPSQLEKIGKSKPVIKNEVVLNDVTAFLHLKGKRSVLLFQSMDKHTARTWMANMSGGADLQDHGDAMVCDAMAESLNIATGRSLPQFDISFGPGDISIPFTVYSPGLVLKSPHAPFVLEEMSSGTTAITLGLMVIKKYEDEKKK